MTISKIKFLFLVLLICPSAKADDVYLTESYLKTLLKKNSPSVEQIESSFLAVKRDDLAKRDQLSFRLDGNASAYHSNERLLNNFDGSVTSSASSYSVGLVKPTRYGVDLKLEVFGEKSTNAFVTDASTHGSTFSISVDLFKDFLGRQTNSDLKRSDFSVKRAKLEKKSSLKAFETNVKKLYWSLVANSEQQRLIKNLIKTAKTQYEDAQKRQKAGAADSGEVARFKSVWNDRKADLFRLEYRKAEILKSLKQLLPALNYKKVKLGKYNIQKTISSVLMCTQKIATYSKSPFQNTVYDDIVKLLEKEERLEQKVISRYNGPDVKLNGQVSTIGRGFGYQNSHADLFENGQPRSSVQLNVSIPLGSKKSKTKKTSELFLKKKYKSQAKSRNLSKCS